MLAVAGVVPALQFGNHLLQARRLRVERGGDALAAVGSMHGDAADYRSV